MSNIACLVEVPNITFVPGTFVQQSVSIPFQAVCPKRQVAIPFFGTNSPSGSTPVDAVQLWPQKL